MGIFNIFKKQEEPKNDVQREVIKSYTIEFPYRGKIELEYLDEEAEDDKYIDGKDIYLYLDEESINGINSSWNDSDMINFIDNNEIKNKINNMELSLKKNGICNIYVKVYEELTSEDKEYILNYVKGQASDGWGEGNFDYIYNKETKELYFYWDSQDKLKDNNCIPFSIDFWWYDNSWYIKYVEVDE